MSRPSVLGYLLAAIMIVTAVYCVSRLAVARLRGRPTEPDVDIVHVLMGAAMAGMLAPRLSLLPGGAWEAVFSAAIAWFGWQAVRAYGRSCSRSHGCHGAAGRPAHYLPHLLASGAMLYMFLAVSPVRAGPPLPGMALGSQSAGTIRSPLLALVLALALFGYAMWVTDRLPSLAPVPEMRQTAADARRAGLGPESATVAAIDPGLADAGLAAVTLAERPDSVGPRPPRGGVPLSPRLAACCEIVMGIAMGYMLIVML